MKTLLVLLSVIFLTGMGTFPGYPPSPPEPTFDEITLTWGTPEYRENGALLGLEEIDHYNIYGDGEGLDSVDNYTNRYLIIPEESGEYCFTITAIDTDGNESKPSNEVCKTVD